MNDALTGQADFRRLPITDTERLSDTPSAEHPIHPNGARAFARVAPIVRTLGNVPPVNGKHYANSLLCTRCATPSGIRRVTYPRLYFPPVLRIFKTPSSSPNMLRMVSVDNCHNFANSSGLKCRSAIIRNFSPSQGCLRHCLNFREARSTATARAVWSTVAGMMPSYHCDGPTVLLAHYPFQQTLKVAASTS
jgi:hypothetical protein